MRILVAALAVAFCLGPAGVTRASSFEDSHADCSYPETFDLMIMRPLGLASMGVGMALFVPFGAMSMLTTGGMGEPLNTFVLRPMNFTFNRPLGNCLIGADQL